jgi:DNA-binding HxlR family transcriptional regulator
MLTLTSLERDGLVTRTVYPTNPPRVDYELTERAKNADRALARALNVGSDRLHCNRG